MRRLAAPKTQPSYQIVTVTPLLAKRWLASNGHNRNLRQSRVDGYARDMAAGAWRFNADPVRFAVDGTLLDGQHRLHALAAAGVDLDMLVVWGLPTETQETMDIGAHRTMADALSLRGETNTNLLAAVLRRVVAFDSGIRATDGGAAMVSHPQMSGYLARHPEIRRAVEVSARARQYRLAASPSVIGAAYHLCARIHRPDADRFYVTQLIDSVGLASGDPALVLARRFAEEHSRGRRMDADDTLRYTFLAWNHHRAGRKLQKLQAPKGGWTRHNFPEPR